MRSARRKNVSCSASAGGRTSGPSSRPEGTAFSGSVIPMAFPAGTLSGRPVDARVVLAEFDGLLFHSAVNRLVRIIEAAAARVVAYLLGNLHRTELGPAHGAEVRDLVRLLGQCLVVILAGALGVQAEVELIVPPELEARLGQGI